MRRASGFLLHGQEKVTKEKATLLDACRAAPDKSVSRGRAFRSGILPVRKGADIGQPLLRCLNSGIHALAMSPPLRACRPRLSASQGG
jgi:hypothetical protein